MIRAAGSRFRNAGRLVTFVVTVGACDAQAPVNSGNDGHDHKHDAALYTPTVDAGGDSTEADVVDGETYAWRLPIGFPVPVVPSDNRMSAEKVELGRHLFYDRRLSRNQTQSCSSCHDQKKAFTDGRATGLGSTGEAHSRSSMSLANIAYVTTLTWSNPLLRTLEDQAAVPLFGIQPVELGLQAEEGELLRRLRAEPRYERLFASAFPGDVDSISVANVLRALASFERVLISGNAPYDRYLRGEANAISPTAKRGEALFNSERLDCFHCHTGFNLQDSVNYVGKGFPEVAFHNTGLYNLQGSGAYPHPNVGLFEFTRRPEDMGRFRAPTLRNVGETAPYMHDGSIASLSEVLDHYAAGGRTIAAGPNAGTGSANPYKSGLIVGFTLSTQEKAEVIAFLQSLTDLEFLTDERFSNPWTAGVPAVL